MNFQEYRDAGRVRQMLAPEFGLRCEYRYITDDGKVWSTLNQIWCKPTTVYGDRNGYYCAAPNKIVAAARIMCFLFKPESYFPTAQALHTDGNPMNDTIQNLRWGDGFDNMEDRRLHGRNLHTEEQKLRQSITAKNSEKVRRGEQHYSVTFSNMQVREAYLRVNVEGEYYRTVADEMNVNAATLFHIVSSKTSRRSFTELIDKEFGILPPLERLPRVILTVSQVREAYLRVHLDGESCADVSTGMQIHYKCLYEVVHAKKTHRDITEKIDSEFGFSLEPFKPLKADDDLLLVAYARIKQGENYKEVADSLGFQYKRIRRLMKKECHKHLTDQLDREFNLTPQESPTE